MYNDSVILNVTRFGGNVGHCIFEACLRSVNYIIFLVCVNVLFPNDRPPPSLSFHYIMHRNINNCRSLVLYVAEFIRNWKRAFSKKYIGHLAFRKRSPSTRDIVYFSVIIITNRVTK